MLVYLDDVFCRYVTRPDTYRSLTNAKALYKFKIGKSLVHNSGRDGCICGFVFSQHPPHRLGLTYRKGYATHVSVSFNGLCDIPKYHSPSSLCLGDVNGDIMMSLYHVKQKLDKDIMLRRIYPFSWKT